MIWNLLETLGPFLSNNPAWNEINMKAIPSFSGQNQGSWAQLGLKDQCRIMESTFGYLNNWIYLEIQDLKIMFIELGRYH